jgi:hypothetical protein
LHSPSSREACSAHNWRISKSRFAKAWNHGQHEYDPTVRMNSAAPSILKVRTGKPSQNSNKLNAHKEYAGAEEEQFID